MAKKRKVTGASPARPSVPGRLTLPETSQSWRATANDEVRRQRQASLDADVRRRKESEAMADEELGISVPLGKSTAEVPGEPVPAAPLAGGSSSSAAPMGKPKRRASARELAAKEEAAARKEAKGGGAQNRKVTQTSAAEAALAQKKTPPSTSKDPVPAPSAPITEAETMLAYLGHDNVHAAGKGKAKGRAPGWGKELVVPADTRTQERLAALKGAKNSDRRANVTRRAEDARKRMIESGLAASSSVRRERKKRRIPADIAGMSEPQIRATERAMAVPLFLEHTMAQAKAGAEPSTGERSGQLGGLRVNTRYDTEIPRVNPSIATSEFEVRDPATPPASEVYRGQKESWRRNKEDLAYNKSIEDAQSLVDKSVTNPTPEGNIEDPESHKEMMSQAKVRAAMPKAKVTGRVSGRVSPVGIATVKDEWGNPVEYRKGTLSVTTRKTAAGETVSSKTRTTSEPVASGSDVVTAKLPMAMVNQAIKHPKLSIAMAALANRDLANTARSGSYGAVAASGILQNRLANPSEEISESADTRRADMAKSVSRLVNGPEKSKKIAPLTPSPQPPVPAPLPIGQRPSRAGSGPVPGRERMRRSSAAAYGGNQHLGEVAAGSDLSVPGGDIDYGRIPGPGNFMAPRSGSYASRVWNTEVAPKILAGSQAAAPTGTAPQPTTRASGTAKIQRSGQYVAAGQYAKKSKPTEGA